MPAHLQTMAIETGFQEALASFSKDLTKAEREHFEFTTLEEVKIAVMRIQAEQESRKAMMNLPRIRAFLEAMDQFSKVIEIFLNTSQFVAFIWGPLKFLLQVSSTWAESFDVLLDAYSQIAENMPLMQQYRSLFNDEPHMKTVLEMVYLDILEFHRRALRIFSKPKGYIDADDDRYWVAWKQLFRATWKDFNTMFQHILGNLQRHKGLVEAQASLVHFQESQLERAKLHTFFERTERIEKQRQFCALVDWLSAPNTMLDQEAASLPRQDYPGSGCWLLENAVIRAWRDMTTSRRPIVWLYGIPGAGKTTLASLIIDDCVKIPSVSVAFFYCRHGDPQRSTFLAVAKSVLLQLLRQDEELLPFFYDRYNSNGELILSSMSVCKELLETALKNTSRSYIILDGLDECDVAERKAIVAWFKPIIEGCDQENPGSLRALFISQNENDIEKSLRGAAVVQLTAEDHHKDIEGYVQTWSMKIQEKFGLRDADRDYIALSVCSRATGMFLFAKLVMAHLYAQTTLELLQHEIRPDRFPKGLEQAYERIVARIAQNPNDAEREAAQMLLGWMVCAKRPLRWHEIQGAVSLDTVNQTFEFEQRQLRKHIRELCGSLIDVLPGDRVELVHSTAKFYLVDKSIVDRLFQECSLATLCLQYLTFECFDLDLPAQKVNDFTIEGFMSFQDYAVCHWADHLDSFVKLAQNRRREIEPGLLAKFGTAVDDFVHNHEDQLLLSTISLETEREISHFSSDEIYRPLSLLVSHFWQHRASGLSNFDDISLAALKTALFRNRSMLEDFQNVLDLKAIPGSQLERYYGGNWYKCTKLSCFYSHEGFQNAKRRKEHIDRHDRPFRCNHVECSGTIFGFDTSKELDKHMNIVHPSQDSIFWTFPKLKAAENKKSVSFRCSYCPKIFTRAYNLRTHLRTHTDERPFVCTVCGKAFARDGDRRRHEGLHRGEKNFICKGELMSGGQWGCGRRFARADALGRHFRSEAGRVCIKPLLDEQSAIEERKRMNGVGGFLPAALLTQYPELINIDWSAMPQEEDPDDTSEYRDADEIESGCASGTGMIYENSGQAGAEAYVGAEAGAETELVNRARPVKRSWNAISE